MIRPVAIVGALAGIAWCAFGAIARERDTASLARSIRSGWVSPDEMAVCFCGEVIYGRRASYWLDCDLERRCEDGRLHEPFRLPALDDVNAVDRWLRRSR